LKTSFTHCSDITHTHVLGDIGVNFCKAPRLEPPLFKVQGFPASEPPLFVRCKFFCLLWSYLPRCNEQ